jgi:hypothetical protein
VASAVAHVSRRLPRGWGHLFLQLAIWMGFYVAYQIARGAADRNLASAYSHGEWVVLHEKHVGALFEPALQRVTDTSSVLIALTSYTYWLSQFAVVGLTLAWVYFRHHERFAGFRNWLIFANLIGLVGYVLVPTAPPRMFPEWGFIDTLGRYSSLNHDSGLIAAAANPYAAMPSLHAMDALIVAVMLLVELEAVLEPGATAAVHEDPQRLVLGIRHRLREVLDLLDRRVGHREQRLRRRDAGRLGAGRLRRSCARRARARRLGIRHWGRHRSISFCPEVVKNFAAFGRVGTILRDLAGLAGRGREQAVDPVPRRRHAVGVRDERNPLLVDLGSLQPDWQTFFPGRSKTSHFAVEEWPGKDTDSEPRVVHFEHRFLGQFGRDFGRFRSHPGRHFRHFKLILRASKQQALCHYFRCRPRSDAQHLVFFLTPPAHGPNLIFNRVSPIPGADFSRHF